MDDLPEKYVKSLFFLKEKFKEMDALADVIMGIEAWDDAVCVPFGGKKLLVSADGPYSKRIVLKSALVHAATDVAVKGGKALFALDTLIGEREEIELMAESLKKQALYLKIPILGGNTLFEETDARCNLTVVGELVLDSPIRDSGARSGDLLYLLGDPVWGGQEERLEKAGTMLSAWYEVISEIEVHAAKDVTKGGFVSCVYEMQEKSGKEFKIEKIPYSTTRNLDNFLLAIDAKDAGKLGEIAEENSCPLVYAGKVF